MRKRPLHRFGRRPVPLLNGNSFHIVKASIRPGKFAFASFSRSRRRHIFTVWTNFSPRSPRETIWLTTPISWARRHLESMKAAATDGVDVRVLCRKQRYRAYSQHQRERPMAASRGRCTRFRMERADASCKIGRVRPKNLRI